MDRRVSLILKALKEEYPHAKVALKFSSPLEMLIATILSARCTDRMVNKVTERLFRKYRTAGDYASASAGELERCIKSTGFYRNKARSIRNACRIIEKKYKGRVPDTMEGLVALPGVARKTANIVLGNSFGKVEGIAVDTHVKKFALKTGLSKNTNPDKIEKDLMNAIPRREWFAFTYRAIEHGRECGYRKPGCRVCRFVKT
jgi:endonuclease-3